MAAKKKNVKKTEPLPDLISPKKVPDWMNPVLNLPKKTKRKSAIRKKVDKVYKDTVFPNRDEREPEAPGKDHVEISILDTTIEDPIIKDESLPLAPKEVKVIDENASIQAKDIPFQDLVSIMEERFSFQRRLDKRLAELPDEKIERRALQRPNTSITNNVAVMKGLVNSIKTAIQMVLRIDDYQSVCKYAKWLVEAEEHLTKVTPIIHPKEEGRRKSTSATESRISHKIEPVDDEAYAILNGITA